MFDILLGSAAGMVFALLENAAVYKNRNAAACKNRNAAAYKIIL